MRAGFSACAGPDQELADCTATNGWPGGRVGPGEATEGSTRLASSGRDGRGQPFRPPTALLAQVKRTFAEETAVVCGDFSQTKPVSLSNTASLLKAGRMTNLCAADSAWSHRSVLLSSAPPPPLLVASPPPLAGLVAARI